MIFKIKKLLRARRSEIRGLVIFTAKVAYAALIFKVVCLL